jgi:hypothetical protein
MALLIVVQGLRPVRTGSAECVGLGNLGRASPGLLVVRGDLLVFLFVATHGRLAGWVGVLPGCNHEKSESSLREAEVGAVEEPPADTKPPGSEHQNYCVEKYGVSSEQSRCLLQGHHPGSRTPKEFEDGKKRCNVHIVIFS